jgi:hypothetical protein
LNIEGKRSGEGFVVHKDVLIDALSRAQAERIEALDGVTIGRKGFLTYLKALNGSNIIKVIPLSDVASESQHIEKSLKVICGTNTSQIPNTAWISDKTALSYCQIRVSPSVAVFPNLGGVELAEALAKVLPFTSNDEAKPILHTVLFRQSGNKLTLIGCDGFRLAIIDLPFEEGDNEVKVDIAHLKGLIPALKKAKRVKLCFEDWSEKPEGKNLVIETELVKYRYHGLDGDYPEYDSFIPKEDTMQSTVRFDTKHVLKAVHSLSALWFDDNTRTTERPIIITVADGKLTLESKGEHGKAEIEAEVTGEGKTAIRAGFLADALKACNGMVDLQIGNPMSPILFSINGYRLVQMPMMISQTNAVSEAEAVAAQVEEKEQAENPEPSEGQTGPQKTESKSKPKAKKKSKAKEPVAV